MTRIFGLCPRCKSRIKINNVERIDGKMIHCRDCGHAIRIRAPKPVLAGDQSAELPAVVLSNEDVFDDLEPDEERPIGGDEFLGNVADDREIPVYRPLTRRPTGKKKPKPAEEPEEITLVRNRGAGRKGKHSPMVIGLVGGGVLVVVGLLVGGGLVLARSSGIGGSAKFEVPSKYVAMKPSLQPVTGQIPEGWEEIWNGGRNGIPISARINDKASISIDIRETEGSSAKGKTKKAILSGQEVHQIGGPPIGRLDEAPMIAETHEYNRQMVIKDFLKYDEGSGRSIETQGFGEALISDFTAKEGYFSGTIKGCRASISHSEHQYSIVCKCPPTQFKDARPVFEKIIASLGTWEK